MLAVQYQHGKGMRPFHTEPLLVDREPSVFRARIKSKNVLFKGSCPERLTDSPKIRIQLCQQLGQIAKPVSAWGWLGPGLCASCTRGSRPPCSSHLVQAARTASPQFTLKSGWGSGEMTKARTTLGHSADFSA